MRYPVKIRLYANPKSSLYCLVHIWPSKTAMVKGSNCNKSFAAMTCGIKQVRIFPNNRQILRPVFSHMHLNEKKLNLYILSHECVHAALNWIERTREPIWLDKEAGQHNENFINAQDYMLYQLYSKIAKLKLGGWSY